MSDIGSAYRIRISRVHPDPEQPRKYFNAQSIEALADAIEAGEQEVPISLRKFPNRPGNFIIIDGERRWRALNIIQQRTCKEPEIKAFLVTDAEAQNHYIKSVIANLHREDLTPLDEAAGFLRLQQSKMTLEKIAKLVGKSVSYVVTRMSLHSLPDEVKKHMSLDLPREKQLSVTSAMDIARSTKDPALQIELANEVIERQLGVDDTRILLAHRGLTRLPTQKSENLVPLHGNEQAQKFTVANFRSVARIVGSAASNAKELSDQDFDRLLGPRDDFIEVRHAWLTKLRNMKIDIQKAIDNLEKAGQ